MWANRKPENPPRDASGDSAGPPLAQAPSWGTTPPTRAEIAAELADHLALAADEAQRLEATRARAETRARGAFGSVTWTLWHCWWIGHREEAMFRGAVLLLLGVIGSTLGAMAYQGWQVQRAMANQLEVVTNDLGELARQQTDWIRSQQDPARHEIRGRLFRGDPSRPAADVEITVRQHPSLTVIRRLRTDAYGKFRTGRLQAGDYCVLAPLVGDVKNPSIAGGDEKLFPGASVLHPFYGVQSGPLAVPDDDLTVELDIDMQVGTVELAMDDPVPEAVGPEGAIPLALHFTLTPLEQTPLPWRLEDEAPANWPVRGFVMHGTFWNHRTRFFSEQPAPWTIDLGKRIVFDRGPLLAGRYWFRAWCGVSLDRLTGSSFGGGLGYQDSGVKPLPATPETERLRRLFQSQGQVLGIFSPEQPMLPREAPPGATLITVRPGDHVRLKLAPPADYLTHLERVLTVPDPSDDDVIRFKQSEVLAVTVEKLPAVTP